MKTKFYAPLFIGLSLALASTVSDARPAHSAGKKHAPHSAKHGKAASHKKIHAKKTVPKTKSVAANHKASAKRHQKVALAPLIKKKNSRVSTTLYPVANNRWSHPSLTHPSNKRESAIVLTPHSQSAFSAHSSVPHESARLTAGYGIIETTLSSASRKAGLSDDLVSQMANIFAWDIDFASHLKRGDKFTVLYRPKPFGAQSDNDQIYAVEFVTKGKTYTAIRYQNSHGHVRYFTPDGKSMHKAFLSSPVDYARISSHFTAQRKHPVLNRIRAHKGVDYAARTGTPVKAAGDGEVEFIGRKGGYGNVLILKHGNHYETVYAHLSKFRSGLANGEHVRQGQVVGYVGQTGLATGPHLHYEFRIDGVHHNPETVTAKTSPQLHHRQLAEFKSQAAPLLAQLSQVKSRYLFAKRR